MDKKKIILDCDPGMDDSMAIIMACKSDALEVKAITAVNGNYRVDVTSKNALKVLELIGRTDIPVGKGMPEPMVRKCPKDPFTHGKDGQAENNLPDPVTPLSDKNAVELIIDTVKANPGEIYILCTGPMSNVAMAMKKAPEIKEMIAGIYAISGAFGLNRYAYTNATGDTPQSEWNVYVDPEAADIVYNSGVKLVALGLDVATHFDVNLTDEAILEELWTMYRLFYQDEPFVRVLPLGSCADLKYIKYSNFCDVSLHMDARNNRLILVSAIDNMVKGAAGQAIQNMNILFDCKEDSGLMYVPASF